MDKSIVPYDYVVVCHSGAGNHSHAFEHIHRKACEKACHAAHVSLQRESIHPFSLIRAAVEAVKSLEDSPCTNSGLGSNLTINGKVQCEAGIMCGQSFRFGAVGCISNVKNPIVMAEMVLVNQIMNGQSNHGLYPPSVLVGSDAVKWAVDRGITTVNDTELITVAKLKKYKKFTRKLAKCKRSTTKRPSTNGDCSLKNKISKDESTPSLDETIELLDESDSESDQIDKLNSRMDTVGVIIADTYGRVVSATSSGGIFLKQDGRLGHSCIYGCGCFSEQRDNGVSVTAVSSGLGEQLMRTMLPMKTCEMLATIGDDEDVIDKFQTFLNDNFMDSSFISGDLVKSFGLLCLKKEMLTNNKISIDLYFGHSTPSMCFAHMSSKGEKIDTFMSRITNEDYAVGSIGNVFEIQ